MSHGRFSNPLSAVFAGVGDRVRGQPLQARYTDEVRLDGKTCLVTGASSGLGFAIATQMAQRGARVLMACRSGVPEKGEQVKALSGSQTVQMLQVDLSDLKQVHGLADTLRDQGERIDVLVENAGVASPRAHKSAQGLEAMFVTNYVAKFVLVNRLIADGTLARRPAGPKGPESVPRVVFISSDSHQGASAIDWQSFGQYRDFGVNGAINNYSYFKLVMNTFATELSRRVNGFGPVKVSVLVMCPGPVNTNIVRDAPLPLRLFLRGFFQLFFRSPEVAAEPVLYMSASPDYEAKTGLYLHMFNDKRMDKQCYDPEAGQQLWARTEALLESVQMGLQGA